MRKGRGSALVCCAISGIDPGNAHTAFMIEK
jgi:hypothetical protein